MIGPSVEGRGIVLLRQESEGAGSGTSGAINEIPSGPTVRALQGPTLLYDATQAPIGLLGFSPATPLLVRHSHRVTPCAIVGSLDSTDHCAGTDIILSFFQLHLIPKENSLAASFTPE